MRQQAAQLRPRRTTHTARQCSPRSSSPHFSTGTRHPRCSPPQSGIILFLATMAQRPHPLHTLLTLRRPPLPPCAVAPSTAYSAPRPSNALLTSIHGSKSQSSLLAKTHRRTSISCMRITSRPSSRPHQSFIQHASLSGSHRPRCTPFLPRRLAGPPLSLCPADQAIQHLLRGQQCR